MFLCRPGTVGGTGDAEVKRTNEVPSSWSLHLGCGKRKVSIEVLKDLSTNWDKAMKESCRELSETNGRFLFVECAGEGFREEEMLWTLMHGLEGSDGGNLRLSEEH